MPIRQLTFLLVLWAISFGSAGQTRQTVAGKVIVVTGASSGIGKGTAFRLASEGAHVVLAARRTELLDKLAIDCGHGAIAVTTDVAKADDVRRLADATLKRFGHIDVWINNAGVGAIGRFEDIPLEDHSRMIDINLKGVIYGSYVAMKQFRKQGYGILINVGSIDSEVPLVYQASYSASKAGVLSLGRALNEEIRLSAAKGKIKVATVMPWATDTPWWPHAANYSGRTAQIAGMDDPEKVVRVMVQACTKPKEELPVGWKGKASYSLHHYFPDFIERTHATVYHKSQMEKAPSAEQSSGTLHEPMNMGSEIDGGVRARMKLDES